MPNLLEGIETIKSWGFKYKTCGFTWLKTYKKNGNPVCGLGYWTRSNAELCLLATKGKPKRIKEPKTAQKSKKTQKPQKS